MYVQSQKVNPSEPRWVKNWKFIIIAMCIFYALCFSMERSCVFVKNDIEIKF